jgi:outer membrane biosynthesis protein TonB
MEDGSVSNVSILQSVSPTIDAESIRVVKMLPKFTPGILKGKAVPVWYMVPITFKLK